MKVGINLASRPYVELRPVYSRLRIWMVILALVGAALWFLLHSEHHQAEAVAARVALVHSKVDQMQRQEQSYQALMRQPNNAAVLDQADFLNGTFRHKAFSWTATMTDLETVLPAGVQVQSIEPIVAPNGHVTIRMRVSGGREHAVDLIRNLERSRHFASPRLADEALAAGPGGAQGGFQNVSSSTDVNFDILADYRPLPLAPSDKKKKATEEKNLSLTPAPATAHPAAPATAHPAASRRRP